MSELEKKKKLSMPSTPVLLFCIIVVIMILTYIVPAGTYDRVLDEVSGNTVVDPNSFQYVEQSPVNPWKMFVSIPEAFVAVSNIIFLIAFGFFWVYSVMQSGALTSAINTLLNSKAKDSKLFIPICMLIFAIAGSTYGELETVYGLVPIFVALAIALGYDAIIIHAGGSEEAYYDLSAWKTTHFDGVRGGWDASIFWRDQWRMANRGYEHSLLTSGENILKFVADSNYRLEHNEGYQAPIKFNNENAAKFGVDANSVTVRFSNYKTDVFTYDPESGLYMIEGHGQEYIDGNTEEQVGVTNVLVLNTTSQVLDNVGRLRVATTGGGTGTYFCGGKAVDITWARNTKDDPFEYKMANGWDLRWMPGKTYICIINPYVSTMGYE